TSVDPRPRSRPARRAVPRVRPASRSVSGIDRMGQERGGRTRCRAPPVGRAVTQALRMTSQPMNGRRTSGKTTLPSACWHCARVDEGAVRLLVLLEDRDEGATDRERRAVQRVDEARLRLGLGAVADLRAACLKVTVVRAARDLTVEALTGQPHLEVVRLLRVC